MFSKRLLAVLAIAFLLGNAAIVHAQKIYLFSEGDYFDNSIGKAVDIDTENIRQLFKLVPEYRLVIYNHSSEWNGPNFRGSFDDSEDVRNAIFRAIRNCPAGPSDTIVFYWSSHGAYNNKGHFLRMPEFNNSGSSAVYRSEIRRALLQKGARLTVLFTDSCHVFRQFPSVTTKHSHYTIKPYEVPTIFNALFFNSSGVVDINSASPDERAYCNGIIGSYFTYYFCSAVKENLNRSMSWKSLLDNAQNAFQNCTEYKKEKVIHHYYFWRLPGYPPKPDGDDDDDDDNGGGNGGVNSSYLPKYGDRIISVNGINIQDLGHFSQVINNADTRITFVLIDGRTGQTMKLTTDLNPPGSFTRLGIYVQENYGGGVLVTGVIAGTPGTRCRVLN